MAGTGFYSLQVYGTAESCHCLQEFPYQITTCFLAYETQAGSKRFKKKLLSKLCENLEAAD